MQCRNCQQEKETEDLRFIDDLPYCINCLYQNQQPFQIYPIGFIENMLKRDKDFHLKGNRQEISKIHLFPSQKPFIYKLEEEKRIDVLYYLHEQKKTIRSAFPRGLDGKKVGVFASRTPDRLTPIGITNVELVSIEGMTLFVRGLDAINGTPVLDIKLGMNAYR